MIIIERLTSVQKLALMKSSRQNYRSLATAPLSLKWFSCMNEVATSAGVTKLSLWFRKNKIFLSSIGYISEDQEYAS